jgi:hypothetical protein
MPASPAQRKKTAARRAKAIDLYLNGADWQAIADQLGYASRGAARTDVTRALQQQAEQEAEQVATLRHVETQRLDRLQAGLWPRAIEGDVKAAEAVLRIIDRRVTLHGLAAPRRSAEAEKLGEEINDLLAELGA